MQKDVARRLQRMQIELQQPRHNRWMSTKTALVTLLLAILSSAADDLDAFFVGEGPLQFCIGRSTNIFLTWDQSLDFCRDHDGTLMQLPVFNEDLTVTTIEIVRDAINKALNDAGVPTGLVGINLHLDYRDKSPGLFGDKNGLGGAKKEWQTSNIMPALVTKDHKKIFGLLQPSEGAYAERCLTLSSYLNEWKVHDIPCSWGSVGVAVCFFTPLKCLFGK